MSDMAAPYVVRPRNRQVVIYPGMNVWRVLVTKSKGWNRKRVLQEMKIIVPLLMRKALGKYSSTPLTLIYPTRGGHTAYSWAAGMARPFEAIDANVGYMRSLIGVTPPGKLQTRCSCPNDGSRCTGDITCESEVEDGLAYGGQTWSVLVWFHWRGPTEVTIPWPSTNGMLSTITGVDPARAIATLDVACRPKHHKAWDKSFQDVSFADSMEEFAMQAIQQSQRDVPKPKDAFPWAVVAAVGASAVAAIYVANTFANIFAPRRYH